MEKVNATKTEKKLLGLTAIFLLVLLCLFFWDRAVPDHVAAVETEIQVPQAEIVPDVAPLNLNTATIETLVELPGIGEELARRIVQYRTEHGPFETIEELMEVSGIGEAKLAGLDGLITTE